VVCDDAACTSPAISTIDSTGGDVGYFSSIALTSSDEPVISYNDQANGALKLYNQYGSILFIDSAPISFTKSTPTNNATNRSTNITLSWAASTRATSYEYCIALTQAACTNWKSVGSRRAVAVSGLAKGKTYFWQVRAKNVGGTTISSGGYRKFTTKR
jgi:hypothetical protein